MTVEVGFTTNFGERCKEGKKPDVISVEWMQEQKDGGEGKFMEEFEDIGHNLACVKHAFILSRCVSVLLTQVLRGETLYQILKQILCLLSWTATEDLR